MISIVGCRRRRKNNQIEVRGILGSSCLSSSTHKTMVGKAAKRKALGRQDNKLLVLLAIAVCIISVAPIIFLHHSHDGSTHHHDPHKNVLKGSLDNFVVEKKKKSKTTETTKKKNDASDTKAASEQQFTVADKAAKENANFIITKAHTEEDSQNNNTSDPVVKSKSNTSSGGEGGSINNNNIDSIDAAKSDPQKSNTADKKEDTKNAKNENINKSYLRQMAKPFVGSNSTNNIEHELHPVANLNCADHGGPFDPHIVDEMVYWSDIPTDADYLSPMHPLNDPYTPNDTERFLSFEPDDGGWNNIRMAMETAFLMSHAMGRTLVLPPQHKIYNFNTSFGFKDLFHLDAISGEHKGFKVITMEEFLEREAMKGKMVEYGTNTTLYPPNRRTTWGYGTPYGVKPLFEYLRKIGNAPHWSPYDCALAIPSSTEPEAVEELKTTLQSILNGSYGKPIPTVEEFNSNPTPVDAPMADRMREMIAHKTGEGEKKLCLYDKPLQQAKLVHLKSSDGARYLTHFYAFIFFADWKQDLWSKRFVRDHLRYADDIMCAAARIVEAVRERARKNKSYEPSRDEGVYDALHVRRDDFKNQFKVTILPAEKMYEMSKDKLHQGSTLYIATDEKDKTFFKPFSDNYDVVFLDNFLDLIPNLNTNYYGMIDQLVAYKSQVFFGTWFSTMSGYMNRMRGYYIGKKKLGGYEDGSLPSHYFTPRDRTIDGLNEMTQYKPIRQPIWFREFPVCWVDIDKGIEEIDTSVKQAIKK